jgi:hypothetical protein
MPYRRYHVLTSGLAPNTRSSSGIVDHVYHLSCFPIWFVSIPTLVLLGNANSKPRTGLQLQARAMASQMPHVSLGANFVSRD